MLILFFQSGKAQTSQLWQTSKRMMQHMQQAATAKPDIREFIEALEPADFKMKGGKRGTSDMSNILNTIISQTDDDEVLYFCLRLHFLAREKYKAKDNADEYIVAQQIGIKNHIVEKLAKNPNFSIVVMRLTSQFNGIYYNKFDDRQPINNDRPSLCG